MFILYTMSVESHDMGNKILGQASLTT
jgi:hypothetical protein